MNHYQWWCKLFKYSIPHRSPTELVEEIVCLMILSDNVRRKEDWVSPALTLSNTFPELGLVPLREILPNNPKLRIFRSLSWLGLFNESRNVGRRKYQGPSAFGWLPPLLKLISKNPRTIVLPGVTTLHPETLEFHNVINDLYNYVGGFTWELMYTSILACRYQEWSSIKISNNAIYELFLL